MISRHIWRLLRSLTNVENSLGQSGHFCFATGEIGRSLNISGPSRQSLEEWKLKLNNQKVVSSPFPVVDIPNVTYPEYALQQMEKFSQRTFLVNGDTGVEYSYLDSLGEVSRVSSGLIRRGLRSGDRVAFFSFNCPEYILAWFAATAVGAVATDVNPTFTTSELRNQLELSGAKFIFVHSSNVKRAKEAAATLPKIKEIYVFGEGEGCVPYSLLASDSGEFFKGAFQEDPSSTVHLPSSSGTTGLPKGVMRSHKNLVASAYVSHCKDLTMYDSESTTLMVLPFFHIYGSFLIGAIMLNGGKVVLQEKFSPEDTLQLLQKHKVTNFPVVPPLVLFLAQHALVKTYDLSSLKVITCGAAPVSPDVFGSLHERFNLTYLAQGYGTTEMGPLTLTPKSDTSRLSSVGLPVCNTQIKLVSVETGKEVGLETEGEILARGPQIMTGYEQNTEATASSLQDGWLRTGDLGYVGKDGFLYIRDRLKDFIKVKGHQVAPAELESLLLTHPAVKDVAVIGVQDDKCGEVPKAFVVLKQRGTLDQELKIFVAERSSPEKHLLGGVVFLDEIPKSASGKILKKDLRTIPKRK